MQRPPTPAPGFRQPLRPATAETLANQLGELTQEVRATRGEVAEVKGEVMRLAARERRSDERLHETRREVRRLGGELEDSRTHDIRALEQELLDRKRESWRARSGRREWLYRGTWGVGLGLVLYLLEHLVLRLIH